MTQATDMDNPPTPKTLHQVVAWITLLLISLLPIVILQEILGQTVTLAQQAIFSLAVLLLPLALEGWVERPLAERSNHRERREWVGLKGESTPHFSV